MNTMPTGSGTCGTAPVLWYPAPARDLMADGLPIGCGRLAALLDGGLDEERIAFNEESLWIGDEQDTGAYQAFGELRISFAHGGATDYRRELDLDRAIHAVTYRHAGVGYRREAFASGPDQVIVLRLTCDRPGALDVRLHLADAHGRATQGAGDGLEFTGDLQGLTYQGGSCAEGPLRPYDIALDYAARVRVLATTGTIIAAMDHILVHGATEMVILLDAATDFIQDRARGWRSGDPRNAIGTRMAAAGARPWAELRDRHLADHQGLFRRVGLDLGGGDGPLPAADALLHAGSSPALDALLFHYGRYLLIAASRAGGLPANLQGKWNLSNQPPWRCDYHTDINLQMNYWMAHPANLAECFEPFARWLEAIQPVRTEDTMRTFGAPGWVVRGECGLFGGSTWEWIPGASAWLLQNLYDHFRFTLDREFLRERAYPLMVGVCRYWSSRLIERPDGSLVTPRGFSPEHGPAEEGVAFDRQLVWDLFTSTIEAARILEIDRDLRSHLQELRDRLAPPAIGSWGQLQEWLEDRDEPDCTHRHLSHLVAVYPGRQVTPHDTPALAGAARISLGARGDAGTGWSLVHKIILWARLLDGERAHRLIRTLMRRVTTQDTIMDGAGGWYDNLLCAHPPFQIDGNLGYVAAVAEMLVQSHREEIHLLPALPRAWHTGSVRGLRARGGITVDLAWADGSVTAWRLVAAEPHPVRLRLHGLVRTVIPERG